MKRWPIARPFYETAEGLGAGAPADVEAPPVSDDGGLADHEAAHAPGAVQTDTYDDTPTTERGEGGRFKPRHRAASQRADADDLPAINEHTRRVKEAEARLGADIVKKPGESERVYTLRRRAELLERQSTAQPATATAPTPTATPPPAQRPVLAAEKTPADAKPAEKFTYPSWTQAAEKNPNLDYDQWELDRFMAFREWDASQRTAAEQAQATERAEQQRQEQDAKEFNEWAARREAFVAKNPTRSAPLTAFLERVQSGTPIGDAIKLSAVGAELADYLAANPTEETRIAALSPVAQLLELGGIQSTFVAGQRQTPTTRTAAAPTGSAPAPSRPSVPRPPNPVRTGSIAEPDTPPDPDDQSLSAHEKHFGRPHR